MFVNRMQAANKHPNRVRFGWTDDTDATKPVLAAAAAAAAAAAITDDRKTAVPEANNDDDDDQDSDASAHTESVGPDSPTAAGSVSDLRPTIVFDLANRCIPSSSSSVKTERRLTDAEVSTIIDHLYKSAAAVSPTDIPAADAAAGRTANANLLYGEFLIDGVSKVLNADHLNADDGTTLIDLGCGIGKLALQAWLQHPNLTTVVGVEIAPSRSAAAFQALFMLYDLLRTDDRFTGFIQLHMTGKTNKPDQPKSNDRIRLELRSGPTVRSIEFRCGSLFDVDRLLLSSASIVVLATAFSKSAANKKRLINIVESIPVGSRLLTYQLPIRSWFGTDSAWTPVQDGSRFSTSWSPDDGAVMPIWIRTAVTKKRKANTTADKTVSSSNALAVMACHRSILESFAAYHADGTACGGCETCLSLSRAAAGAFRALIRRHACCGTL